MKSFCGNTQIKPDAILIGGDVLNAHPGASVEEALSFLEKLTAYPLYYANGNHEQRLLLYPEKYGSMGSDYEEGLQKLGISRMINETRVLDRYAVSITGCEVDRQYYKRFHKVPMKKEYLEGLLRKEDRTAFRSFWHIIRIISQRMLRGAQILSFPGICTAV